MEQAHKGPGRRFSTGTNRNDHLLGCFGFVSHALLFFSLGGMLTVRVAQREPDTAVMILVFTFVPAVLCLVFRAMQVGATTTKESIKAIRDAWF